MREKRKLEGKGKFRREKFGQLGRGLQASRLGKLVPHLPPLLLSHCARGLQDHLKFHVPPGGLTWFSTISSHTHGYDVLEQNNTKQNQQRQTGHKFSRALSNAGHAYFLQQ